MTQEPDAQSGPRKDSKYGARTRTNFCAQLGVTQKPKIKLKNSARKTGQPYANK